MENICLRRALSREGIVWVEEEEEEEKKEEWRRVDVSAWEAAVLRRVVRCVCHG